MRSYGQTAVVAAVVLVALLAGGCITVSQELTVLEDGGAEVAVKLVMPTMMWDAARSQLQLDELETELHATYPAASIEVLDDDEVSGIVMRAPFASVDAAIDSIVSGGVTAVGAADQQAWFSEMAYVPQGTLFSRSYQFTAVPDAGLLAGVREAMTEVSGDTALDMSLLDIEFSLTVPHAIASTDGAVLSNDRHTATWRLDGSNEELSLTTETYQSVPPWAFVVLVLIVVAGAGFFILRGHVTPRPREEYV